MNRSIKVVQYQRKKRPNGNYSLEAIYADIRRRLEKECDITLRVAPCLANGLFRRLWIALDARTNQGSITHVTGDINFATLLLRKRTTILTLLDCGFVNRTKGIRRALLRFFWLDLPIRNVARTITISEAAKKEIVSMSGCEEDAVEVIPVAISESFVYAPKPFNAECPTILQVGTSSNKNVARLAQALEGIPCRLIIVGQVSEALRQQIDSLRIEWENLRELPEDEVVRQFQRADLVAFCSTYEGFGMPILEGQATGRPVVTSNISSMPEVAGDGACLVDPFDVASIRQGVRKVIEDRAYRDQLIRAGLENVKRFDAEAIADQYLSLYRRVALEAEQR